MPSRISLILTNSSAVCERKLSPGPNLTDVHGIIA